MAVWTPPVLVAEYETASWVTTSTTKTASVTVATGDSLVVYGLTADEATTLATPTGGSLTYTLAQTQTGTDFCQAYLWTVPPVGAGQTFTITLTKAGSTDFYGFNVLRFSGSDGFGTSNKASSASGAPSVSLALTSDHSAMVWAAGDWTAADGTVRTYRTGFGSVTEQTYARDAATYTVYGAFHPDAGLGGNAAAVGVVTPAVQKFSIVAVEVLGHLNTSTPATPSPIGRVRPVAPMRKK